LTYTTNAIDKTLYHLDHFGGSQWLGHYKLLLVSQQILIWHCIQKSWNMTIFYIYWDIFNWNVMSNSMIEGTYLGY
jgi:hypothetical protein